MALPPVEVPTGAMRFNSDSQKLEYWDGAQWLQVSTKETLTGGARGLFGGGYSPTLLNIIDYITISTQGNAVDFGDLTQARISQGGGTCSSCTRGIWGGGRQVPAPSFNIIDYITISTTGNAIDFGDLLGVRYDLTGFSSSTRGIWAGNSPGVGTYSNVIEYITISSTGNSISFGTLQQVKSNAMSCASPTRGIVAGGYTGSVVNVIDYVTIESTGNGVDFGDLTVARFSGGGCSSSTRGVFGSGTPGGNVIDFVTISTLGNAFDFGDLISSGLNYLSSCSSQTRGIFAGGGPTKVNTIGYVTIVTTGNSVYFGDLTTVKSQATGCSNAHGGL